MIPNQRRRSVHGPTWRPYPEAEVHHGVPWQPAGPVQFQHATQRTLTFLVAWGVQQRDADVVAKRADAGQRLAQAWRAAEQATHELLAAEQAPATAELHIVGEDEHR